MSRTDWWTNREIEIIKQHYPGNTAKVVQANWLPHRSTAGIQNKARQLGLARPTNAVWGHIDDEAVNTYEQPPRTLKEAMRRRVRTMRRQIELEFRNDVRLG